MPLLAKISRTIGRQLTCNAMDKSFIQTFEESLAKTERLATSLLQEITYLKHELSTYSRTDEVDQGQKRPRSTVPNSDNSLESESDSKKLKHSFNKSGDYVIVYTDGACTSNGKTGAKAGIGVWFGSHHPLNVSKPCPGRQTNNTAEILACAEACKVAAENGIDKLEIKTDSQFVINCVTKWMSNWKKNNWKTAAGKPVINKDDLLILEKYANALTSVKYEHVNGHAGITGNEAADNLAVAGAYL